MRVIIEVQPSRSGYPRVRAGGIDVNVIKRWDARHDQQFRTPYCATRSGAGETRRINRNQRSLNLAISHRCGCRSWKFLQTTCLYASTNTLAPINYAHGPGTGPVPRGCSNNFFQIGIVRAWAGPHKEDHKCLPPQRFAHPSCTCQNLSRGQA